MTADIIPFPMPDRTGATWDPVREREAFLSALELAELTAVIPQAKAPEPPVRTRR